MIANFVTWRPFSPGSGKSAAAVAILATTPLVAGVGWALSSRPLLTLAWLIGIVMLIFFLWRPDAATALLAASFYFDGYLVGPDAGLVTPSKLIGVVALLSFLIDRLRNPRPVRLNAQVWLLVALSGWILLSLTAAYDQGVALVTSGRYAAFFLLFFLLLQRTDDRSEVERLVDVIVISSGVAALLGATSYLSGAVERASGPLENPNDFAFLLATAVPLALYRLQHGPPAARVAAGISLTLLFAAILATFSRAAVVGLAAAAIWALGTRRIRLRWAAAAIMALLATATVTYQLQPEAFRTTLDHKQRIATENIDSRLKFWDVAIDQFAASPLLGVGPGNYDVRYPEHEYPFGLAPQTTHNAYLDILAELGIPGLVLFLGFVLASWARLRAHATMEDGRDRMRDALAAAFVVALVGALFMTEQYYPPLWFLAALSAAQPRRALRNGNQKPVLQSAP